MDVAGAGRRRILFVGDAPTFDADRIGAPIEGPEQRLLSSTLMELDVDLDDCHFTNAIICNSHFPSNDQVDHCRPNLYRTIKELCPHVIVLLGYFAVRSLLGAKWREGVGALDQWVGWKIPLHDPDVWVVPTYHPGSLLEDHKETPVRKLLFQRHIQTAIDTKGTPWKGEPPDFRSQVRVVMDPEEVAARLRKYVDRGGPVAVDYETNRLKPDNDNARIACCSVCWRGKETIAYPWVGEAITATGELLDSPIPKIGANNKFEERWTRRFFGHGVRNWKWDTMLSAHHLDCRQNITSVKFQAFVRLGVEPWDRGIASFLEDERADGTNRVFDADIRSLLVYCGMDALIEYRIAGLQRKEMML